MCHTKRCPLAELILVVSFVIILNYDNDTLPQLIKFTSSTAEGCNKGPPESSEHSEAVGPQRLPKQIAGNILSSSVHFIMRCCSLIFPFTKDILLLLILPFNYLSVLR